MLNSSRSQYGPHERLPISDDRNPNARVNTRIEPFGHVCFLVRFHSATPKLRVLGAESEQLLFALTDANGQVIPAKVDAGDRTTTRYAALTTDAPYVLEVMNASALSKWVEISIAGQISRAGEDLSATRHIA